MALEIPGCDEEVLEASETESILAAQVPMRARILGFAGFENFQIIES